MIIKKTESFSFKGKSKIGILLIHGFTSNPLSLEPIAKSFAKNNFNIELPLLPGHGTKWQDLNKVKYTDWINTLEISLLELSKRSDHIFTFGLSLGGVLALYLTEHHSKIDGLVLVNDALLLSDPRLFFLPIIRFFTPASNAIGEDIKKPGVTEKSYDKNPLNGLYELIKLKKIVKKNLNKIICPVLSFKSKEDHVVPIKSSIYTLKKISSKNKELIWLNNSYHVATLDYDQDIIIEKSIKFIINNSK
jgi:carboxylesterase